jgi:REP element-mobilizing transposase RayT
MIRGIEGLRIFQDNQDREDFLSRIGHLVEITGTRILAWVLMDNHVHLLIFSGQRGIVKFMQSLLTGYAIRFNQKYRRKGHLFQNRYKSIVCEKDPYLLELVRYIHLNPLRASVVKSIEELDRYPWSGHSVIVGKCNRVWQEREYVLMQFNNEKRRALQAYRRFIEQGKDRGRQPEFVGGGLIRSLGGWSQVLSLRCKGVKFNHDSRILGGGDFVTGILGEADSKLKRQLKNEEREVLMNLIIKKMCQEKGVKEEELKSGGQRRKVSEVRAKVSCHLCHEWGIPMAEIARRLGVCTSAIAKAIKNMEAAE